MFGATVLRCSAPACRLPKMLPLLFFAFISLQSAAALSCYDCLSLSQPECTTSSKKADYQTTLCKPDEEYCSVLFMKDAAGKPLLSRQCASRTDEGDQLKSFIEGTQAQSLQLVHFTTCRGDLCNVQDSFASLVNGGHADASGSHGGRGKGNNGSAAALLPSAIALALPLAALLASAAPRRLGA